jgi:hypothetical protein
MANTNLILAGVAGGAPAGTGLLSVAPVSTGAPADASATPVALPAGWLTVGWCADTGFTDKHAEQTTEVGGFGTTAALRSIIKSSIESFSVDMLETNPVTLAIYNRVPLETLPTYSSTTGALALNIGTPSLPRFQALFEVVDGASYVRYWLPLCAVTARVDQQISAGTNFAYSVTLTAYANAANVSVRKSYVLDALRGS